MDTSARLEICAKCRYYHLNMAECRRYPPVVHFGGPYNSPRTVFPEVSDHHWCGEWASDHNK